MKAITDDFGMQCRARTKDRRRCKRSVRWLVTMCLSRESWLAALRTGWPRIVRGMKEPEWSKVGLCHFHGSDGWHMKRPAFYYGIGKMGMPSLDDDDRKAASAVGDDAVRAAVADCACRPDSTEPCQPCGGA